MGDAAQLGRALDGNAAAHEPDEGDPGGERLAAVLQDGAGEGGGRGRPVSHRHRTPGTSDRAGRPRRLRRVCLRLPLRGSA